MNLAIVWYYDKASDTYPNWKDGLRSAIELIAEKHTVKWFLDKGTPDPKDKWDFILFWDDSNSAFFKELYKYQCRKGMCLTTDPTNWDNLRMLDVVYCETQPIYDAVRAQGLRAIKAFGTDTDFYCPDWKREKDIEYFYPATFSPWKLQRNIAHLGQNLLCVGTVQPDGHEDLDACKKNGVKLEIGYFVPEKIKDYYQRAKKVRIPAIHGSERTVLEAMACNILPDVNPDNKRAYSLIEEYRNSGRQSPQEFAETFYSHRKYARELLKGIES